MFGPVRGEWDRQWNGWWGDPPFHAPVFVLTHHAREPQPMDGGTTYYFVTDGTSHRGRRQLVPARRCWLSPMMSLSGACVIA
jgi:hypothetical protein